MRKELVYCVGLFALLCVIILPNGLTSSRAESPQSGEVVLDPHPQGPINYINSKIPEFQPPKYSGQSYEALVPYTLDVAERMHLAVNYLTRTVNPNMENEPYNMVDGMLSPPGMWHVQGDFQVQGKYLEMFPIARTVTGSRMNEHVDFEFMKMFLKMQGPDGLIYAPTSGRPWVLENGGYLLPPKDQQAGVEHICTLGYGTARALSAFSLLAANDPKGPWAAAARRLAEGIKKTLIVHGDTAYMFDHWITPGRPITEPKTKPRGIIAGGDAWTVQALIQYHRALKDPEAVQIAEKIMTYIMRDSGYFTEEGQFKEDQEGVGWAHFHAHAMCILACLYVVEETGNQDLLNRALKAYEYGIQAGNGLVGFFPEATHDSGPQFMGDKHPYGYHTSETCEVVDMIICAMKFSKLGIDKWDDADRWLRNQFAENQLTQINWMTDGHLDYSNSVMSESRRNYFYQPGRYTTDRVAERTIGGFASHPNPNDFVGHPELIVTIANCCSGNGPRALYYAWREMLTHDRGGMVWTFDRPTLKVNLLLNRASKWVDIESHIPYSGRVDFRVKQNLNLQVRIPEWASSEEIQCTVDNKSRALKTEGRYTFVGEVNSGQFVALTFPISERTESVKIQNKDYQFVVRGNTVVSVDPPGKYCPLYQRGHYREGRTLYKKVTRFVPDDEFVWW